MGAPRQPRHVHGDEVTQQIQIAREGLDRALEENTAAKRKLLSTLPPADDESADDDAQEDDS